MMKYLIFELLMEYLSWWDLNDEEVEFGLDDVENGSKKLREV